MHILFEGSRKSEVLFNICGALRDLVAFAQFKKSRNAPHMYSKKFFKNSVKLLVSPFPVMSLKEHSKYTWVLKGHSRSTKRSLEEH